MKRTYRDWGRFFHSQIRVGKNKKAIKVTKIRTMKNNAHSEFDKKFNNRKNATVKRKSGIDKRISGRMANTLRRSHLDELPQISLWLKGELNIAGIRPITRQEYMGLPTDLKKIYNETGPGLISILYSTKKPINRKELHELYRKFYAEWKKSPTKTRVKWGTQSLWGIIKNTVNPRKKQ